MIPLPRKTKRSNLSLVRNRADKTVPLKEIDMMKSGPVLPVVQEME